MGANMNSKGSGNDAQENLPSVYSLTFDEFRTAFGKEFGSMNMEELLKSIWSAEEIQNTGFSASGQDGGGNQGGFLQRQGSVSLPRPLSLKTVDEVWKDIAKKDCKDSGSEGGVPMAETRREPTLGEITLEEFLVRAGVVREESNGVGDGISFQQPNHGGGLTASRVADDKLSGLPVNVNGVRSTPKRSPVSCAVPKSSPLASPGIRGGIVGVVDQKINGKLGHGSVLHGAVAVESPDSLSSDGMNSDGDTDTPSGSPVPFMFGGRKSRCAVETAIERRHRRMVMNRESAARSRARKDVSNLQAYAMELEEELAKLKEENKKLKKLQEAKIEMERNQMSEEMEEPCGPKKRRLMKTLSAPAP